MLKDNNRDIQNDIKLFKIYKNMSYEYRKEIKLLLTPENILNITIHPQLTVRDSDTDIVLNQINSLSIDELTNKLENDSLWKHRYAFDNLIIQIKTYFLLRPEITEKYPEYQI